MYRVTKTFVAEHRLLLVLSIALYATLCGLLLQSRPDDSLLNGVVIWWTALCVISVCNVGGWRLSASALWRRRDNVDPALYRFQRLQLLLSAVYVFGCSFRSILPRADVQRIGLYDSWLSSVMVGRSVATVAELCFMIQWALLLNLVARQAGSRWAVRISWVLVPLIVVAETCSWYAVLTTSYLGNAIEESIWATSATLLIVSAVLLWPRCSTAWRPFLAAALVLGVTYVAFMCMVDVPMYVTRWQADEASGRAYLSLSEGLHDVWSRRSITFNWEDWRTEVPWMSLYFSVAVWSSIGLIHVPSWVPQPRFEQ